MLEETKLKDCSVGWHDRGNGHGDYGIIANDKTLIAKVETGLYIDAALMSNAYDLYKMCEELISNERTDCNDRNCGDCSVCRTRKIMKRAEGQ